MQREIKFRAWDNEHKCFNSTLASNLLMQLHEPSEDVDKDYGKRFFLSEFIGQKDDEGKEIFEDDIVEAFFNVRGKKSGFSFNALIKYNESFSEWQISYIGMNQNIVTDSIGESYFLKVIGNMFENPELFMNGRKVATQA